MVGGPVVRGASPARRDMVRACRLDELVPGRLHRPAADLAIVLCRLADRVYALSDACPHRGAALSEGTVVDGCVECPLHGERFSLSDGSPVLRELVRRPVATYDVEVRDGDVYVRPRRRGLVARALRRP